MLLNQQIVVSGVLFVARDVLGDLEAKRRVRLDGAAQDVASRDVRDAEGRRESLRLGPLPHPGRTEEKEVLAQKLASNRTGDPRAATPDPGAARPREPVVVARDEV